jgi:hypothetical protein
MWLVPERVEQKHAILKEKELDRKLSSFINEGRGYFSGSQSEIVRRLYAYVTTGIKEEMSDYGGDEDSYFPVPDVGFDPDKCYNCTIENNHTVVHSNNGGRGYALGNVSFQQGTAHGRRLVDLVVTYGYNIVFTFFS